jgi:hypothetical protein
MRWAVDKIIARRSTADIAAAGDDPEARARAEIEAIRKSETSPGVLLASGYIAGGSLAGVMLAFMAFSDELPKDLSRYEYRTMALGQPKSFDQATKDIAREYHGIDVDKLDPKKSDADYWPMEKYNEIRRINSSLPAVFTRVSKGTVLQLPIAYHAEKGKTYTVPEDTTLGQVAEQVLGRSRKAPDLLTLNKQLKPPEVLPAEAEFSLPQPRWPAVLIFGLLAFLLLGVGVGWILKSPEERTIPPPVVNGTQVA